MEWISVKDRLPEEAESVAVLYRYECINGPDMIQPDIAFYAPKMGGWWFRMEKADDSRVMYWCPLPDPPKEEK